MHRLFWSIFVWLFIIVYSKRTLSQFEASCFPGCQCTQPSVTCHNLNARTTEVFQKFIPLIYPDLDTLVVTGNNFGALLDEDLFGNNSRHEKLSLANLTNNGITYFGIQTFIGMPRVEYFYLSDNKLDNVGEQPFTYLTSLQRLDMNNVFASHVSVDARADIVKKIFRSNHSFIHLKEISLKNNQLHYLHKDTFCKVQGLEQLFLSDNGLTTFDLDLNCLKSLTMLVLGNNRIATIPQTIYTELSLRDLDVSKNPLICDCKLQPFIEYARDRETSFINQENTICVKPSALEGQKIFDMENINLCRNGTTFFHWVILLLIGAGFLLGYRFFRRHGRSIRIPFTVGYSPLKSDEGLQPAFV